MLMMFYIYFLIMLILLLMVLMNLLFSKKLMKNREKMSPFECGFDTQSMNRLPFSLQFYLISIIFLIFDVEIALILPMVKSFSFLFYLISINCIFIILILLIGLLIEWKEGALKWFK